MKLLKNRINENSKDNHFSNLGNQGWFSETPWMGLLRFLKGLSSDTKINQKFYFSLIKCIGFYCCFKTTVFRKTIGEDF